MTRRSEARRWLGTWWARQREPAVRRRRRRLYAMTGVVAIVGVVVLVSVLGQTPGRLRWLDTALVFAGVMLVFCGALVARQGESSTMVVAGAALLCAPLFVAMVDRRGLSWLPVPLAAALVALGECVGYAERWHARLVQQRSSTGLVLGGLVKGAGAGVVSAFMLGVGAIDAPGGMLRLTFGLFAVVALAGLTVLYGRRGG